jgi:hypothetical protein
VIRALQQIIPALEVERSGMLQGMPTDSTMNLLTRTSRNQTGSNLMSNNNGYIFRFAQSVDGAKRWKRHFFLRNTKTV